MSTLPDTIKPRVAQLVRMFGSPHDGEALGAVRAIGRTLAANGGSFGDLAEMIERGSETRFVHREGEAPRRPDTTNTAWPFLKAGLEAATHSGRLTPWEGTFVSSILSQAAASRSWHPSPKQDSTIRALLTRLGIMGARS